jgi:hypothetical protein
MRALSIRQPWAWLIVNGHKPIENRDWATAYRGEFLIHASKTCTQKYFAEVVAQVEQQFGIVVPCFEVLERGGVVGVAEIVDCVTASDLPWFTGEFGFVLANARSLPFLPFKGALSFFDVPGVRP